MFKINKDNNFKMQNLKRKNYFKIFKINNR